VRAGKAYIASFGTTGVLITSSLLMLTFVSTLVAFRAWPGADAEGAVRGLVVEERQVPAPVVDTAERRRPARSDDRAGGSSSRRSAPPGDGDRSPVEGSQPGSTAPTLGGGRMQPGSDSPAAPRDAPAPQPLVSAPSVPSVPAAPAPGGDPGAALGEVTGGAPQLAVPLTTDPTETVSTVVDGLDGSALP
jgi:hypothetical protein